MKENGGDCQLDRKARSTSALAQGRDHLPSVIPQG